MFEFAESVLKKEKEEISEEREILKENLRNIKNKLEIASDYRSTRNLTLMSYIAIVAGSLFVKQQASSLYEIYLSGSVEAKFIIIGAVLIVAEGINVLGLAGFGVYATTKLLIKSVKQGARTHNKNREHYQEKQEELEEEISLHSDKIKKIDIQLDRIQFCNDTQKPLYQATTKEEYEVLMKKQKEAESYLEEYLNEPIDYSSVHLETNQYSGSIHKNYGKTLVKTYNKI